MYPTSNAITNVPIDVVIASHDNGGFWVNLPDKHTERQLFKRIPLMRIRPCILKKCSMYIWAIQETCLLKKNFLNHCKLNSPDSFLHPFNYTCSASRDVWEDRQNSNCNCGRSHCHRPWNLIRTYLSDSMDRWCQTHPPWSNACMPAGVGAYQPKTLYQTPCPGTFTKTHVQNWKFNRNPRKKWNFVVTQIP